VAADLVVEARAGANPVVPTRPTGSPVAPLPARKGAFARWPKTVRVSSSWRGDDVSEAPPRASLVFARPDQKIVPDPGARTGGRGRREEEPG